LSYGATFIIGITTMNTTAVAATIVTTTTMALQPFVGPWALFQFLDYNCYYYHY
jgi:hypothetical protein